VVCTDINGLIIVCTSKGLKALPHPALPLKGRVKTGVSPFKGEIERGMGFIEQFL